jgi:hypothetical protein
MQLAVEPAPRRLGVPPFAVLIVSAWGAMVALGYMLSNAAGADATPCLFKNATGVPCAACGGTRATFALAQGDPIAAFAFNPLVVFVLVVSAAWTFVRIGFGRRVRVELGRRECAVAWTIAACLFAANWAYVINAAN